jgi:hypothetical protein
MMGEGKGGNFSLFTVMRHISKTSEQIVGNIHQSSMS